ncbi:histone lysine methyltransferase Set9 [Malassezia pachydermatis]|uniref:Histone tail methylase n=1 Tax=Malassezia pachydermatis TaxID=77020 RepID=A0A0N0RS02_9BASI|nr:histone tail methylase [Malassezia pachydermatis]KOS13253.1 histone tail methylase [Malassezia pachydermatis]
MDELPGDDDFLSCMLLDSLEFEPSIVTHKMNPHFRPVRFDRDTIAQIIRRHVIWERDITKAVSVFNELPVVRKHVARKTPAQRQVFDSHVQRYMQAYLPTAGFEYAVTYRYRVARLRRLAHIEDAAQAETARYHAHLSPGRTDLCVLALRSFQPDDTITFCTAALKDLTRAEDEALREEAAQARAADVRDGHVRPQRDFSIIRSSSRKCSQLLLGPARFINHDCQPNAEFRRSGNQLTIRCIRPIKRNEEITTYYGDNYFELGNKECMCATCEKYQRGFFASHVADESVSTPASTESTLEDGRTLRSRSAREAAASQAAQIVTSPDDMIAYQLNPDAQGPECECLTCHALFRAPEKWWTPDECARCERHYKLFKCDWPGRYPKENPAEQTTIARPLKRRAAMENGSTTTKRPRAKTVQTPEPTVSQDISSPVKLSPVRECREASPVSDTEPPPKDPHARPRSLRRFELHSDDSDDALDAIHLGPRILGHGASTDVLASYWGAPEGERRVRRPTTMGMPLASERIASAHVTKRVPSSSRPQGRPAKAPRRIVSEPSERSVSAPLPKTEVPTPSPRSSLSPPPPPSPPSPPTTAPVIATKGPARTSISNLALFWSGGVEGRTRQQAKKAQALASTTQSPRTSARVSRTASPAPVTVVKPEPPSSRSVSDVPLPLRSSSPAAPAKPVASPLVKVERSASSLSPGPSEMPSGAPQPPLPALPPRPTATSLPPGVPPRQPLRRNLRWGNGKTSMSRPPTQTMPMRVVWPSMVKTESLSPAPPIPGVPRPLSSSSASSSSSSSSSTTSPPPQPSSASHTSTAPLP